MSKHSFPFYKEQLEMILAVTKMLNEHSGKVPIDSDYYFRVQLVEAGDERVIGEWSDEVGPDCWEFSLAPSQIATKPEITVNQSFQLPQHNVPGARTIAERAKDEGTVGGAVMSQGTPGGLEISIDGTKSISDPEALRIQKYEVNHRNVQLD